MSRKQPLTWFALALAAGSAGAVHAQPNEHAIERLEVTLTLLPPQADSAAQAIQRIIELPPPAVEVGDGQQPEDLPGLEHGRGDGLETAVEAIEGGRDFGADAAAAARENRENAGRGEDPPGPPENLPGPPEDLPGPPEDLPSPPGNPGPP
jgi:hypothetical protein